MEFIEEARGQMLSLSWETYRGHHQRRDNLFRRLAKIMLSLQKLPFEAIGSSTINDSRRVVLENRPFTLEVAKLENEGVSSFIPKDHLYRSTEAYYLSLIHI